MTFRPKLTPISDDYKITKNALGNGISGKVVLCESKKGSEKYALKTLKDSDKARREINLQYQASFTCPNIVKIIDVYQQKINGHDTLLVVMELMKGGELFHEIIKRPGQFTEKEVAKIMHQICSAVKHIHGMGIAHRDLKPENILLTSKEPDALIKLTDFGFAKETTAGLQTPCFTPYYVAPEVLGSETYGVSCDIWSLGVIMYILLCGYPPFSSSTDRPLSSNMKNKIRRGSFNFPEREWAHVSESAKDLIKHMLEINPQNRFSITDVMNHEWISKYIDVPSTPLLSVTNLPQQMLEIQKLIFSALGEMRIDEDEQSNRNIKEINISENPLFKKRMNQ